MPELPFEREERQGVLFLTLNTPGSDVNIFDHRAATQLKEILESLNPASTRAVVFKSSKPGSFINGVGLMLASSVQKAEDAARLSEPTRQVYTKLRELKIPTIAAVQGNCYGCGVEFILNCDYRVASDTYATHFYMTEIHDYLFIPIFGATQHLPALVGLDPAADLLLWGERWSAPVAKKMRLVDEVFVDELFDERVATFVQRLSPKKPEKKSSKAKAPSNAKTITDKHMAKIKRLPSSYQSVYASCLNLLAHADEKTHISAEDYQLEVQQSAQSLITPASKAALSFFFIRQSAKTFAQRQAEHSEFGVSFGEGLEAFKLECLGRKSLGGHSNAKTTPLNFLSGSKSSSGGVSVVLKMMPKLKPEECTLYAPAFKDGIFFFEISQANNEALVPSLCGYLEDKSFLYVLSNSTKDFAFNRFLSAFASPVKAYLDLGGKPQDVVSTLTDFGYKNPVQICHVAGISLDAKERGKSDSRLLDSLSLSLTAAAFESLRDKSIRHPAIVDLIARELLDFPLQYCSLCRYATRSNTAHLLERVEGDKNGLVSPKSLQTARNYVDQPRDFYLTT